MSKIKLLPPKVSELIAAGEVVERPVSVVKELVENSLDAGAKRIIVEIENGGKKLIKITDDGWGMSPQDAEIALQRFATSKISRLEDLELIHTLGFRGEALPSIASVSHFTLLTREPETMEGINIRVEGGEIVEKTRLGCPAGTTIEVKELFYNTPARRKFLHSSGWETSKITELISRLALYYQGIDFHLIHNGKEVLSFPPTLNLKQKLGLVLGIDEDHLLEISNQRDKSTLHGLIGTSQISLNNREGQIVFLKGRLIKNPLIYQALIVGFGEKIERGRYPVALLFMDLPGEDFDINVHPSKAEVRFAASQEVFALINEGVKKALNTYGVISPTEDQEYRPSQVAEHLHLALTPLTFKHEEKPDNPVISYSSEPENFFSKKLKSTGQIADTYLTIIKDRDLYLLDQHAAAERITYERLREQSRTEIAIQELLFPEVIELRPSLLELVKENLETFAELGLNVEIFGETTVLLRSMPVILSRFSPQANFMEIMEELENEIPSGKRSLKDQLLISMACKGSLKAGEPLSGGEIEKLFQQLQEVPDFTHCPHGRPTVIKFSLKDLDKMFKRQL